ncbi:hypothetical protein J6590_048918 [Homalodisca vitripennis]|nr:hypothetical protein J6590_048918 [Homalodisca vitripennis]
MEKKCYGLIMDSTTGFSCALETTASTLTTGRVVVQELFHVPSPAQPFAFHPPENGSIRGPVRQRWVGWLHHSCADCYFPLTLSPHTELESTPLGLRRVVWKQGPDRGPITSGSCLIDAAVANDESVTLVKVPVKVVGPVRDATYLCFLCALTLASPAFLEDALHSAPPLLSAFLSTLNYMSNRNSFVYCILKNL